MVFEEVVSIYTGSTNHRSKERDVYSLKNLRDHFAGRVIEELRRCDVRQYIQRRTALGIQPGTINRELRFLSAAINFVRLEHDRADLPNPAQGIGLPEPECRVRWITKEEASALIAAAQRTARRPHLPNFIRLGLNTGCRRNEMLGLEWARVDFDRQVFGLEGHHTKNGRRRSVPLNREALAALRDQRQWVLEHCPASPWVFGVTNERRLTTLQKGFAASCQRAEIENFRIHDLRHTFASWLVMEGVSLYVVKDLLGHSSVTVTERYAHLSPDLGKSAVQLLA
ncbi:MAG: site-specific integrase [Curvibacter sp.]|nr:MAG: site-specific integrase [Curvibacter sp.]